MQEIWKDVVGYEGLYQVSNLGRVKSFSKYKTNKKFYKNKIKEKLFKLNKYPNGYLNVSLSKNLIHHRFSIHRLVALAFISNPENKPDVNHKDGLKENNCVENLEWVTKSENMLHHYRVLGNTPYMLGTLNKGSSKPVLQFDKQDIFIAEYPSAAEAERQTGIKGEHISNCARGISSKSGFLHKTAGGFKWQIKNK